MSRRIRFILILLMLLSAVVATSWVAAQSDTEQPTGNTVIPGSIFVRSGPGEQYVAVGALFAGNRVTPVNRSQDGFWILIPYNRSYGWVQRYLIRWENEAALDLLPILEPNVTVTPRVETGELALIPTFTPEGNWVRIVAAESAYLRAGPGRTYLRLGQLLPGEQVEPVSRNADGNWIMIRYINEVTDTEGFAWIARSLVSWVDVAGLDDLPVVDEANLTPTLTFTPSTTSALSNTPSDTPTATDTATATHTPTHTATPTNTATQTETPSVTPSNTATPTATNTPIPTNTPTNVPTATDTPSTTPSNTATATSTNTPTNEPTATNTATDVPTATHTAMATEIPSITPSDTPTATSTNTPTDEPTTTNTSTDVPTATDTPTDIPTITPSDTATATNTSVPSNTPTDVPTDTPIPSATLTDEPTEVALVVIPTETPTTEPTATDTNTPTNEPTATDTPSVTPSATSTVTNTPVPSDTPTDIPSNTPVPSDTPTDVPSDTPMPSNTSTTEPTQVAVVVLPSATDEPTSEVTEQAIILPETAIPTEPITAETVPTDNSGITIPLEAIIGVSILLIVLGYIFLFWRGLVAADRYRNGFVIDECPVCKRGGLTVEEKPGRLFGIPQTRRTIRCDVCRSVLRETGAGRWRYAVDRIENPTMYDRFNGKEISDDELLRLSGNPPKGSARPTNPTFVDEDNPDKRG